MRTNNWYIRETGNFITHFVPAIFALPGLYLLLQKANSNLAYVAAIIYGFAIFILFSVSAIYHSIPKSEYGIRFWQKFDHCCIYLMIAGSFSPTALLIFDDWLRWFVFGLIWFIAIIGCLLKILNRLKNQAISTGLYIGMGCVVIPFLQKMLQTMPLTAIVWLIIGGIFYVGGTYFYAKDKPMYKILHTHQIWHVFVNLGALAHFIYNYYYVFGK
jgi:hemolysin III